MFFEKKKEPEPVSTQPPPTPKSAGTGEVCQTHRIIGCRQCFPAAAPTDPVTKELLDKGKDVVKEFDMAKEIEVSPTPKVDATTLTFIVWVMYKLDMITRIQVRDFLLLIKDGKWPMDVVKYLQDEVKKI